MGRKKAAEVRLIAQAQGWLDPEAPLPEDVELKALFGRGVRSARNNQKLCLEG